MNWKIGQKLVCIESGWIGSPHIPEPKKDEVYTFAGDGKTSGTIRLKEFASNFSYAAICFRPVTERRDAVKSLTSTFIEVVETADCPIQTPQQV